MPETMTMNRVIHSAVRRDLDRLAAALDAAHAAMSDALDSTAKLMQQYAATGSPEDAAAARAGLDTTRAVVERHLTHEERELEPMMLPHLESKQWKQVEKQLRKLPPTTIGRFFAWVTDGMDPESRAYLRSTIPRPVVTLLSRVFGRDYHRRIAPVWR